MQKLWPRFLLAGLLPLVGVGADVRADGPLCGPWMPVERDVRTYQCVRVKDGVAHQRDCSYPGACECAYHASFTTTLARTCTDGAGMDWPETMASDGDVGWWRPNTAAVPPHDPANPAAQCVACPPADEGEDLVCAGIPNCRM